MRPVPARRGQRAVLGWPTTRVPPAPAAVSYEVPVTEQPSTPFHDVQDFLEIPRLSGLALSPDGSRLVTSVSTPGPDRVGSVTEFVTALWEIDPAGARPARRLTRGTEGERSPAFTPDGDLLFVATRRAPDRPAQEHRPAMLWLLPALGGEARPVGGRPGGVDAPSVAASSGAVLVTSMTMPGAVGAEEDGQRREARRRSKVSAILHTGYPIRYWDHDLGPDHPRLLVGEPPTGDDRIDWRDLTPEPGAALRECHAELTPDGSTAVTDWRTPQPRGEVRASVLAVQVATGARRALLDDTRYQFTEPRISPDGTQVAALRERLTTPTSPPEIDLVLVPLSGGAPRALTEGWDRWPAAHRWTPDGTALIVAADQDGRGPLFRVSVADGSVVRLTADDGVYTDPCLSPDGRTVFALRNTVGAPPAPVRLDATTPDQHPSPLPGPAETPRLPGRIQEVRTRAPDGTGLRSWLVLPSDAADNPPPLLLWIHGGPLNSWNSWHWRWNPWLMVARGYAVLLPDPALSTGYGLDFVRRGWGRWGEEPYADLLALTDAAMARPDVDQRRSAAMGGSFGGYMANWIAGHTDRFDAVVSHAGLWALDQFGPTTDTAGYWKNEMTPSMAAANSPHRHVANISTPMLVIHGDRDYRVPVGEALRLWYELMACQPDPEHQPHRFLMFPDENHWVLRPQHSALWYDTVLAFLDEHVLGRAPVTPEVLR